MKGEKGVRRVVTNRLEGMKKENSNTDLLL